MSKGRVIVAMSGGVDSSVVAGLLCEQGFDVVGVHMKLHDADPDKAGHCCGLDDALDARRVADRLGIAFSVLDLKEAFQQAVMDDFVAAYRRGETPNPCVQCNGVLKFRVLLQRALALGATVTTLVWLRLRRPDTMPRSAMAHDFMRPWTATRISPISCFPSAPRRWTGSCFPLAR